MEVTDEKLPRLVPEVTPESLAEFSEQQQEWQKRVKVPDFLRDKAVNRVFSQKVELQELIAVYRSIATDPNDHSNDARLRLLGDQIGEILAANGDFTACMQWVWPGPRARLYAAYGDAEKLPDDDQCEHYKGQFMNAGKKVEHIFIERDRVPSAKYGMEVPILLCNVCGHRNMRPLTPDEEKRFRN